MMPSGPLTLRWPSEFEIADGREIHPAGKLAGRHAPAAVIGP